MRNRTERLRQARPLLQPDQDQQIEHDHDEHDDQLHPFADDHLTATPRAENICPTLYRSRRRNNRAHESKSSWSTRRPQSDYGVGHGPELLAKPGGAPSEADHLLGQTVTKTSSDFAEVRVSARGVAQFNERGRTPRAIDA